VAINYTELSRTVSHALRHEPWLYELEIDNEGWTSIEALITEIRRQNNNWNDLSQKDLQEMIDRSDKQRHQIAGNRIRALYGHSLPGKLQKTAAVPPETLYHGTSPEVLPIIEREGLKPMNRQYVHLSVDHETANLVGRRKTHFPVILAIDSEKANRQGVHFYSGNERVWLADSIPPEFITKHGSRKTAMF
jgi:putative RNA 2'-phosphotransferase